MNARRVSLIVLLGLGLLVSGPAVADAQLLPASAEITSVKGTVEVLRRAQTQWIPAATGLRLVDGDQIRALEGGSAELSLIDGSTILVAENTRFAVVKLEHDPQTGARTNAFQLIVGKVRADVTRAATLPEPSPASSSVPGAGVATSPRSGGRIWSATLRTRRQSSSATALSKANSANATACGRSSTWSASGYSSPNSTA